MLHRNLVVRAAVGTLAASLGVFDSPSAHALQPLETFLAAAERNNPDARAASADARKRDAEVGVSRARLLPSLTARGTYTRNQYEAKAMFPGSEPITITPLNQLDAYFTLDVPLVDLSQFARFGGQKIQAQLAAAQRDVVKRSLVQRVVRAYYTFAATQSLRLVALKNLEIAERNARLAENRLAAGTASPLDVDRATANVEQARHQVADAELSLVLAERALETLSMVHPEPLQEEFAPDLHDEVNLDAWMGVLDPALPELRAAQASAELAEKNRTAARYAFAPVLVAQAQERITNATGFTGKNAAYALMASLTCRFDFGLAAQTEAAKEDAQANHARAEGTRRTLEDGIVDAFHRVKAGVAKLRAATAQAQASARAAAIAEQQYAAGTGTQVDVTTAQKDAFVADVSRLQAGLDLFEARANLRIACGKPLNFSPPIQTVRASL